MYDYDVLLRIFNIAYPGETDKNIERAKDNETYGLPFVNLFLKSNLRRKLLEAVTENNTNLIDEFISLSNYLSREIYLFGALGSINFTDSLIKKQILDPNEILLEAARYFDSDIVNHISKNYNIDKISLNSALMIASQRNNVSMIEYFIKSGADNINEAYTYVLIEGGRYEVAKYLESTGAEYDKQYEPLYQYSASEYIKGRRNNF